MRLIFVRHGDPDYENDTLTEAGWIEAKSVAKRIARIDSECGGIKNIYVSPLGRARDTASCSIDLLGRKDAITLDWLREFPARIHRPDNAQNKNITWDWLPSDWTKEKCFYSADDWANNQVMKDGNVLEEYEKVCKGFDELMESHGYRLHAGDDGYFYETIAPNNDTLVFFCHFGLESVLISHMINCSPMILWHNFCALPTSITTVVSEERRKGVASFRVTGFGDISHLYSDGIEPSFSARFCECYDNEAERHD